MYKLKQCIKTAPKFNYALILYQYATKLSSTCICDRSLLQANGTGCRCAHASRYGSTASIISLLIHICISIALNIVTHPKLTYEHQLPSGIAHPTLQPQLFRFLHTLARFKFLARHFTKLCKLVYPWESVSEIQSTKEAVGKRLTQSAVQVKVVRNLGVMSRNFFCTGCAMC